MPSYSYAGRKSSRGRSRSSGGMRRAGGSSRRQPWRSASRAFVPRGPLVKASPFPDSITVALPYCANLSYSTGAVSAMTNQSWSMNSVFDPDYTGGGHQPQGFDEYSALYDSYRVNYVDVEIQACLDYDATETVIWAVNLHQGTTSVTDIDAAGENLNSRIGLLQFSGNGASAIAAGTSNVVYKQRVYPNKIMGLNWNQYLTDAASSTAVTGSPAYVPRLTFGVAPNDATAQPVCTITRLVYNTTFFKKKLMTTTD